MKISFKTDRSIGRQVTFCLSTFYLFSELVKLKCKRLSKESSANYIASNLIMLISLFLLYNLTD